MALDRTALLSDVFSAMDINSDGRIDLGEFLRTTRSTEEAAELPLLFANLDDPSMELAGSSARLKLTRGDGDGKLDLDEWTGGMSELFGSASDADFEKEMSGILGVLSSRSLETTTVPNLNFTASVRTAALDEEYNAEEPEAAEADAALGRREVADLGGATKLVELILNSELPPVLCGAAAALFNLALEPANVAALIELGALPRLIALLGHPDLEVQAAMAGVLMNCAGRSEAARAQMAAAGCLATLLAMVARTAAPAADGAAVGSGPASEVLARALGALANLLLDAATAAQLRGWSPEGEAPLAPVAEEERAATDLPPVAATAGVAVLLSLLGAPADNEALLEDAAACLDRVAKADADAPAELQAAGALAKIVPLLDNPNEELELRLCALVATVCKKDPTGAARTELHSLGAASKLVELLRSSAEEVQEAAAAAIEQLSQHAPAARVIRKEEGLPLLVDLMASTDLDAQHAAMAAIMNVCTHDPKAAAAIREAEGLRPLVHFLSSAAPLTRAAAAVAVEKCAANEANKELLRELGAIEPLLQMLSGAPGVDVLSSALGALCSMCHGQDEARQLVRLQGGLRRVLPLLYDKHDRVASLAAQFFYEVSPNAEVKVAMRLSDALRPLIALLSSPVADTRLAAAGALMYATQNEATNQLKCRELGAIVPLLSLLEAPNEGPPDRECQRRAAWALSNVVSDPPASRALCAAPTGLSPLVELMRLPDADMQRPAAAAIFNATANDPAAPAALAAAGGLDIFVVLLRYAANDENPDVVAWSAGTLLNCAAGRGADFAAELLAISPPPVAALVGCLAPDVTDEKYDDAQVALYELQRANAAGALMNLVAVSDGVTAKLLECNGVKALADALAASREDALGACFAAGALANVLLMAPSAAADAIVAVGGAKPMVEALEAPPPPEGAPNSPLPADAQRAACVALLNACAVGGRLRDELLEAGAVDALVGCLLGGATDVQAAAAGALVNACTAEDCANALRDAASEEEVGEKLVAVGGLDVAARRLLAPEPLVRARAAGVLFNAAAFGPDNRQALLDGGGLSALVASLADCEARAAKAAADGAAPAEHSEKMRANLLGAVVNLALNPGCRAELRAQGAMPHLLSALASSDAAVLANASTAIAYMADKSEYRPGAPLSPLHSTTSSAAVSMRKQRYHTEPTGAAAEDEPDDAPGARSKAAFGTLPAAKLSATHDSSSKGPRTGSEPAEAFTRRNELCVKPAYSEEAYDELPSPLPSPEATD